VQKQQKRFFRKSVGYHSWLWKYNAMRAGKTMKNRRKSCQLLTECMLSCVLCNLVLDSTMYNARLSVPTGDGECFMDDNK
jgi:hypothetical protein